MRGKHKRNVVQWGWYDSNYDRSVTSSVNEICLKMMASITIPLEYIDFSSHLYVWVPVSPVSVKTTHPAVYGRVHWCRLMLGDLLWNDLVPKRVFFKIDFPMLLNSLLNMKSGGWPTPQHNRNHGTLRLDLKELDFELQNLFFLFWHWWLVSNMKMSQLCFVKWCIMMMITWGAIKTLLNPLDQAKRPKKRKSEQNNHLKLNLADSWFCDNQLMHVVKVIIFKPCNCNLADHWRIHTLHWYNCQILAWKALFCTMTSLKMIPIIQTGCHHSPQSMSICRLNFIPKLAHQWPTLCVWVGGG